VWQIAYCIIAGLVVVVFPFFIFYYENDDEGMESREKSEGSCLTACALRFAAFKRSFCVAFMYTVVCVAIGVIGFLVLRNYIAFTQIPYKLITVGVGTQTFLPLDSVTNFATACGAGVLCPCGTGSCTPASSTLRMDVTIVVFLAACISFLGWFFFSIYVGIGFIGLPMDSINAFIHRPKLLTFSEAATQRKVLLKRSEELIKIGDDMAARLIDAQGGARNKRDFRNAGKLHKVELNRFRLLVDMLEKDLEDFQLGDPQNYRVRRQTGRPRQAGPGRPRQAQARRQALCSAARWRTPRRARQAAAPRPPRALAVAAHFPPPHPPRPALPRFRRSTTTRSSRT
jgi:hypothetical protein